MNTIKVIDNNKMDYSAVIMLIFKNLYNVVIEAKFE